jgi:uncharacterized paraquat-inducible protein A
MKGIGGFFRNLTLRLSTGLRRFMEGRYGSDKLNTAILVAALVLVLVYTFLPLGLVKTVLWILSYVLMFWAIYRMLSRNTYRRYQENRRFLQFVDGIRDREHRYYDCPNCRQRVRVPRGKGKISISCPKCREKFVRKT